MAVTPTPNPAQFNPYAPQIAQYQRNQRLADLLRSQAMSPIDVPNGARASWTQGAAKLLSAYLASGKQDQADQGLQQINSMQYANQLKSLHDLGVPDEQAQGLLQGLPNAVDELVKAGAIPSILRSARGSIQAQQPMQQGAPQPAQPSADGQLPNSDTATSYPMNDPMGDSLTVGVLDKALPGAGKAYDERTRPTDAVMTTRQQLAAQGISPGDPRYGQAFADALYKGNYVAPVAGKGGETLLDPKTNKPVFFAPKVEDGIGLDYSSSSGPTASALPGYAQGAAEIASTKAATLAPIEVRKSVATAAGTVPYKVQEAVQTAAGTSPITVATSTGMQSGKDTVSAYNTQHEAAKNAPTTIALLDSIEQLADKTLAGPGASKVQFVNGVLNTLGIKPGADAAQNYQIMKKNLNQLTMAQRNAAGGGGSDALQALAEAANPNVSEMNAPAIKEAAQELKARQRMAMAIDRVAPNPTTTSPQEYQRFESQIAPLADYRIWQLEHASNDAERARIIQLVPENERASLIAKAKQARAVGLLGK
jgi:hypothetical protein